MLAAALLQGLVLVFMAGEREWVLRTGRTLYLRTAPVDPRDPFRGDYIHLDYEIGHVRTNQVRDGLPALLSAADQPRRDTRVYTALRVESDSVAHLDYATDRRPGTNLFIRGRTQKHYGGQALGVRYGIEALFVPQNQGNRFDERRRRDGIQVPLEMQVAISGDGLAVLKSYRWGPLGIGLTLQQVTNAASGPLPDRSRPAITGARVELMNASSNTLAIVDLPGARSLTLDNDTFRDWGSQDWSWVGAGQPAPPPTDADVRLLRPGETYPITVDFTAPDWAVRNGNGKTNTLGALDWGDLFRLVYRPPSAEACQGLREARLIWHGELMSRAFGGGRID